MTAPTLTIAIPTFRRPEQLATLLAALPERIDEVGGAARVDVLVVDNDPAATAREVVAAAAAVQAAAGLGTVRYVVEPEPGIVAVRNRALDEASARLLAFIDDDEVPLPQWLAALVETWRTTQASAITGRVVSVLPPGTDPWVLASRYFERPWATTGTPAPVAATGNLLLDREAIERMGVRFDARIGLGLGEDSLFTRNLIDAGGRVVWCAESIADDPVPAERANREWVQRRIYSQGHAYVVVDLHAAGGGLARARIRATAVATGAARIVVGAARHLWGRLVRSERHRIRGTRGMLRGRGIVDAAIGRPYEEYARDA